MFTIVHGGVSIQDTPIIYDFNLAIKASELHVLMGPNGSGKSTLSLALAGHPDYNWSPESQVYVDDIDLLPLDPDKRAQQGLFLSFQHPVAVPGISVAQLIKTMTEHLRPAGNPTGREMYQQLTHLCQLLHIKPDFLQRSINENFSGGEQKRLEMLQLLMARPKLAILDEIDSGLDVDAVKLIAAAIEYARSEYKTGFLVVTHYRRIVDHLTPDKVHLLVKGRLVKSDGPQLIDEIEQAGYGQYLQ